MSQDGKITVSSNSIKSMVKEAIASDPEVNLNKVETIRKRDKFNLILSIEANSNINLAEKTASIQDHIKKLLKRNIGIEIDHVEVKLLKIKN